jgi:NADH dehydrogenase FAD-containing subunit
MSPLTRCLSRTSSLIPRSHILESYKRWTSSSRLSILPDDIYDIVIVGGGIAGLALATSIGISNCRTSNSSFI